MEPGREEQRKALEPSAAQKPKRFRIVKLEERVAPSKGAGEMANTKKCWSVYCPSHPATWCVVGCY